MLVAELFGETWEDLLWGIPILNLCLLIAILWSLTKRLDRMALQRIELDNLLVQSVNQVVKLLGASASREGDVAANLEKDRQGVRSVAKDLKARTQRADDTNDDPGSAADAASKSK